MTIRRIEKYKQSIRVEFICGWRALARARADFDALSGVAASLTASIDEVPALVTAQVAQLKRVETDARKRGGRSWPNHQAPRALRRDDCGAGRHTPNNRNGFVDGSAPHDGAGDGCAAEAATYTGTVASPPGIVFCGFGGFGSERGRGIESRAQYARQGRGGVVASGRAGHGRGRRGTSACLECASAADRRGTAESRPGWFYS